MYYVYQLLNYGLKKKLIEEHDVVYCANKLIDILKVEIDVNDRLDINSE